VTSDEINWLLAACRLLGPHPAEQYLLHAEIREVNEFRISTSSVYKFTFEDGNEAAFKSLEGAEITAAGHNHTSATALLSDVAAWVVAKALGHEELVGGAVLTVTSYAGVGLGSLQHWLPGEPSGVGWQSSAHARTAALFDALIAQQDRNGSNFNYDDSTDQIGLFDNSFAFAVPGHNRGSTEILQHVHSSEPTLEQDLLDALARFEGSAELAVLQEILPPDRFTRLRERASRMRTEGELLAPHDY
jgi:hypothetical protein